MMHLAVEPAVQQELEEEASPKKSVATKRYYFDDSSDDDDDASISATSTVAQRCKIELDQYKLEKPLKMFRGEKWTCPLEWWKKKQLFYPHLAKLALEHLCIPAAPSSSDMRSLSEWFKDNSSIAYNGELASKMLFVRTNLSWYENKGNEQFNV